MRRRQTEAESFAEYWREDRNGRIPMKWEICGTCRGNGTHVNRAIDGNGLSRDDPDLDEDFWETYFSGGYDVRCEAGCDNGKIKVVDEDQMTPEMKEEWKDWLRSSAETDAIYAMERRMGA